MSCNSFQLEVYDVHGMRNDVLTEVQWYASSETSTAEFVLDFLLDSAESFTSNKIRHIDVITESFVWLSVILDVLGLTVVREGIASDASLTINGDDFDYC